MGNENRRAALERLDAFIGTWRVQASFPATLSANAAPSDDGARSVFEWVLGGEFVVERSIGPAPAPDSLAIMRFDAVSETYSQHYFDSRGVVRVYAMTLHDDIWMLLRDSPDSSPLDFSQRFNGRFSDDGESIVGRWETSRDGSSWEHDFDLTYTREPAE